MVLAWINQCCGITCIVIIGQIVHLYIRMVLVQLPAMVSVCTLDVGMMRIDYIYFIDEGLSPHIGCCAEIEDDEVMNCGIQNRRRIRLQLLWKYYPSGTSFPYFKYSVQYPISYWAFS